MKKSIRLAAASLACLLALSACGTAASSGSGEPGSGGPTPQSRATALDPKNPVTLTLWHYYVGENQLALESAVAEFNQTAGMEKGVIVDPVALGSIAELEKNITDSAAGVINSLPMPDIFSSYPDKAMEIDQMGMIADLNQYFTRAEQEQYIPSFLSDGVFSEGRLLLLPIVKSTELFYVNATDWNEFAAAAGFGNADLSSWEGVYDTAQAYYNATDALTPDVPGDGKALIGFDSVANYIIIACRQMGLEVIRADGQGGGGAALDEAVLRRVFDVYYQGVALGYFGAVSRFRSDDIKSGDLIGYVGSSSSASFFPTEIAHGNQMVPIDFLALPYPVFEGGEHYAIQQGAGMCIAKNDNAAREEGAAEFLKWFTARQQNINFAMTTGYLPVEAGAYGSAEFERVLDDLRNGDEAQQVVAAVYEIALEQIQSNLTYAAKPFPGSYDVRSFLQATLRDAGDEGFALAQPLREAGLSEEEVLEALDTGAAFAAWMQSLRDGLDDAGISYTP